MGTFTRHPRVAPDRALQYKDWVIPPGVSANHLFPGHKRRESFVVDIWNQTPCSPATYFVQTDPHIYPNPKSFDPWRWIRAAEKGQHLESNLALFSKGSRSCLGIK